MCILSGSGGVLFCRLGWARLGRAGSRAPVDVCGTSPNLFLDEFSRTTIQFISLQMLQFYKQHSGCLKRTLTYGNEYIEVKKNSKIL